MRSGLTLAAVLTALSLAGEGRAALTDSEKAQIVGFVKGGDAKLAARVRSLVGRPDLSAEEAAEPLIAAYRGAPFDAARAELTHALLFGPGSDAARSTLVGAVIPALLARATEALGKLPASANELVRIHAFVSQHIAGSGAKIRDEARKQAALAYQKHLEQNAKWLKHGSAVDAEVVRVRAQAQLATVDLAKNAFGKNDVAGWLGLSGARQRAFVASGVLIEDGGSASEERLELVVRLLEALPKESRVTDLWLIHKAPVAGLWTERPIARARALLGASPQPSGGAHHFGPEVAPLRADRALAEVAFSLALSATRAAFAKHPELVKIAERLAADSAALGRAAYLAPDLIDSRIGPEGLPEGAVGASALLFTAHAVRLVLLDAPRAITFAAVRALGGRTEPAAQLALALGVLAPDGAELRVGKSAEDGSFALATLGDVKRAGPLVRSFALDKDRFDLGVGPDGRVAKLSVNGAEPKLSKLSLARLEPASGEKWIAGGIEWTKISGSPRALVVDDGRFVVGAADKSSGFDALAAGNAAVDASVRATLKPFGTGGGLVLRTQKGEGSYDGIALLISAEPARAELVLVDGKGRAIELAPAVELPPAKPEGFAVTFAVSKNRVTASVGGKKLEAKLERAPGSGQVALTARRGGRVEVRAVSGPTLLPQAGKKK